MLKVDRFATHAHSETDSELALMIYVMRALVKPIIKGISCPTLYAKCSSHLKDTKGLRMRTCKHPIHSHSHVYTKQWGWKSTAPNFFTVAIQHPGSSSPLSWLRR